MNEPLSSVIREAREKGDYACARCDYALRDVPLQDDLSIICPECGYDMVFEVKVRLKPRDPNFDGAIRGRLRRLEVVLVIIGIGLVATAIAIGIIVMAIVGG
ncbi:MAG: hypothetical protein ACF8LL_03160 [Phycisphaerales bacterium]